MVDGSGQDGRGGHKQTAMIKWRGKAHVQGALHMDMLHQE